jgi:antagonist of KipI
LRVLEPGLCSLIVDHGRPRSRSLGVPVGGAADRSALAIGNALLGNADNDAALEITLVGPSLVAEARVGGILFGAPFQLSSSRQTLTANKSFTLEAGEELHIGGTPCGVRAYLCVVGGFQTPVVLDSRSSLVSVGRGAELPCAASSVGSRFVRQDRTWSLAPALTPDLRSSRHELRVVAGPQADWFVAAGLDSPVALPNWGLFAVRPASNRMGMRLQGRPLPVPAGEMVSEAVCPGSIQVTRDGQAIVLGVDGQTVGGYPKIAEVISADLDMLGQIRPGAELVFVKVSLDIARQCHRQRQHQLRRCCQRLRLAAEAF